MAKGRTEAVQRSIDRSGLAFPLGGPARTFTEVSFLLLGGSFFFEEAGFWVEL